MDKVKLKLETFKPIEQLNTSMQETSQPITPQVSPLESALRGGAQGLTMGLSSRGEALLRNLAGKTPFLPEKSYEQALQESRQAYKQAQEANPLTYTGSEFVGSVLPALIPGTQPATLGRMVALGAGLGAVGGLGYSEAETLPELGKDIAAGGALGGVLPVVGRGITKGIQALKPAADISIKSGLSAMTGKTIPYLEKVESQPERVKRIEKTFTEPLQKEIDKLANEFTELVSKNPFREKASKLSSKSYKILEREKDNINIPKSFIMDKLDNKFFELASSQSEIDYKLSQTVSDIGKKLNRDFKDNLNGVQAKNFIRELDTDISAFAPKPGEIKQLPPEAEKKLRVLEEIRNYIDEPLKQQSTNYAEAMKPTADATRVSKYLEKLAVSQYGGKEASAEKAKQFIQKKLKQSNLTESRSEGQALRLMQEELQNPKYNNLAGIDKLRNVNQTISDLKLLQEIQATGAIGSSVTNRMMGGGAAVGSAIAGTPGTILGTIGGALLAPTMERQGGQIASRVLRATQPIRTGTISPKITQPIERGITRGGLSVGLDQYLQSIAEERNRQKQAESRYEQLHPNRVEK